MSVLKQLFGKRRTTKTDVVLGIGAAILAAWKAVDTVNEYKKDQAEENNE